MSKIIESCSDGIQNQNESEIDCGGPCDPCRKFTLDNYPALFLSLYSNSSNTFKFFNL